MLLKILPYLCLVLVLSGCSSGLSRSKAAALISERLAEAPGRTIDVHLRPSGYVSQEEFRNLGGELGVLIELGYVGCKWMPEYVDPNTHNVFRLNRRAHCMSEFTDKGRKESMNWQVLNYADGTPESVKILIAKPKLLEVTGVTQNENVATVTYMWRLEPLNEVGAKLDVEEGLEGVAYLQKFDDGWRLVSH